MKSGIIKAGLLGMTALVGVKAADTMGVSFSDIDIDPARIFSLAMAAEEESSQPAVYASEAKTRSSAKEEEGMSTSNPDSLLPELIIDIAEERKALAVRADLIEKGEAGLALARASLAEQSRQLLELRNEIENLLKTADGNHEGDIGKLVKMYAGMKPENASSILDSGDIAVSVQVIAAMKESDAGPILAGMSPVRAQAISKIIYERSRLPADQDLIGIELN